MASAFIIRPFGTKKEIDFESVERELIGPALEEYDFVGRTTGDSLKQGNIRTEMFRRLLIADVVIVDISIDNANVFYELGIRHALRSKRTFMIRGSSVALPPDEVPFDLRTDRYLSYEVQNPAAALDKLKEGLRAVGRALFRKKAYGHARDTWEAVRDSDPNDIEANLSLGTIYQRLNEPVESNMALQRVLNDESTTEKERAEAHSLIGSNLKGKWKAEWIDLPTGQRQPTALRSPFLEQSYEEYKKGFIEDLDHFYSGINALGMLTIMAEMATALPDVWNEGFEDDEDAERRFREKKDELANLRGSVTLSLEAAKARKERAREADMWFDITLADFACLTSNRPLFVANQYRKALANAQDFEVDAVRRQLLTYQQLGVVAANVTEALKAIPSPEVSEKEPPHVLLFTGHRIDSPKRKKPRFPADKEDAARLAIKDEVEKELARVGGAVIGIAGGASGGDILFHEVCSELSIPTTLYLAMPRDEYVKESVQDSGPQWVNRFDELYNRLQRRELSNSKELPRWLQSKDDYTIWQRNNLWILYNAMACGSRYVTLIALWDGKTGEGPGGTKDMVNKANESAANTIVVQAQKIFGL